MRAASGLSHRAASGGPQTAGSPEVGVGSMAEAGFVDVAVHDVPDDPFDSVYVARTPA